MKTIVLGCGNIGYATTMDLSESLPSSEIVVADKNKTRAEEIVTKVNRDNVSWTQLDVANHSQLVSTLRKFDLTVSTLPGSMGFKACKAAIDSKVDIVDVSYMPENIMALQKDALKTGVRVVPDTGMAPGLSNILVGRGASRLDSVGTVHILNGGLPEKPVPPLSYVITWSAEDLIDMYSRKVTVVKGGKAIKVDAMSGLEEITFPGVGKLEGFYTDGLRTLLYTLKGPKEMWEKSLRYPGHTQKIELLKALGFLDEEPVKIRDFNVVPRELTARLLEKELKRPEVPDIVVMLVKVTGVENGRKVMYTYQMLDRYDKRRKVTAMGRTTGYTTSIMAQFIADETIKEKGIFPPEKVGMNAELYQKYINAMSKRGMVIQESKQDVR
nr:saccharopine dehydrogenase family protein [Candidatus Njordarchaeota archaeon]